MRKLLTLIMVLVLCFGVVGCNNNKKTNKKNEVEKEVIIEELSWKDDAISIAGNVIEFPVKMKKLSEIGFNNVSYEIEKLEPGRKETVVAMYGKTSCLIDVLNPCDEENEKTGTLAVEKCDVVGIRVPYISTAGPEMREFVLPGGLNILETTIEEIIKEYGEPTEKVGDMYTWVNEDGILEITVNTEERNMIMGFYISNQ